MTDSVRPREVAVIACRGVAIYAVVGALNFIWQTVSTIWVLFAMVSARSGEGSAWIKASAVGISLLPPIILAAGGVILWWKAGFVADRMLAGVAQEGPAEERPSAFGGELQTIAFAAIGVLLLAVSVPGLIAMVVGAIASHVRAAESGTTERSVMQIIIGYLPVLIKAGIGACLLFGARNIVTALRRGIVWLRAAGRREPKGEKKAGQDL